MSSEDEEQNLILELADYNENYEPNPQGLE